MLFSIWSAVTPSRRGKNRQALRSTPGRDISAGQVQLLFLLNRTDGMLLPFFLYFPDSDVFATAGLDASAFKENFNFQQICVDLIQLLLGHFVLDTLTRSVLLL
jgi:hypothetical protein